MGAPVVSSARGARGWSGDPCSRAWNLQILPQKTPKAPRSSRSQPETARRGQKQPGAARNNQDQADTDTSNQKQPGAARRSQEQQEGAKSSQEQPETGRSSQEQPEAAKNTVNSTESPPREVPKWLPLKREQQIRKAERPNVAPARARATFSKTGSHKRRK